jgi:F0F1-type ATP synthase membrane subunit b/b'
MDIAVLFEIIGSFGFPIARVIALGLFVLKLYKASEKREAELRAEIKESQEINKKFADIISRYSVEITEIKTDIKDIKEDMIVLTQHISQ